MLTTVRSDQTHSFVLPASKKVTATGNGFGWVYSTLNHQVVGAVGVGASLVIGPFPVEQSFLAVAIAGVLSLKEENQ